MKKGLHTFMISVHFGRSFFFLIKGCILRSSSRHKFQGNSPSDPFEKITKIPPTRIFFLEMEMEMEMEVSTLRVVQR